MRVIKMYHPPDTPAPVPAFLASLDLKLQKKILRQLYRLSYAPLCDLKEPHFKHFSIERYNQLFELREKNRVLIRMIFTISEKEVILLAPFLKRQPRDTERALEQSLKMLSDIRNHPEAAVTFQYHIKEEFT